MKALVTGCAGFIGSHLVEELLNRNYQVTGIDCFTDYYPRDYKEKNMEKFINNSNFTFYEQNLLNLDLSKFVNVDYIFHEAAQAGVRKSWGKDFKIYIDNNILATQKLLEVCKDIKTLEKFVFASSSSVYGDVKELPMKENSYPNPLSPYGASKLACESLCYLYWKNYGVPIVSLRYFTVYGERQRPDMAFHKFIRAMIKGELIEIYGDGGQTRDFTYVGDIIKGTIQAAESDVDGEIFNIGGGSRISLRETLEIIERLVNVGGNAKIEYVDTQMGDMRHTFADTSKAEKLIGFRPEISVEEGLRREVEWVYKLYGGNKEY